MVVELGRLGRLGKLPCLRERCALYGADNLVVEGIRSLVGQFAVSTWGGLLTGKKEWRCAGKREMWKLAQSTMICFLCFPLLRSGPASRRPKLLLVTQWH